MTKPQKAERDAAWYEQFARKWYGEKLGFGNFAGNEVVGPFGQEEFFLLLADLTAAAFEAGRSARDGCIEELLSDVQYLCDESHIPSAASRESVLRKAKTRVKKLKKVHDAR